MKLLQHTRHNTILERLQNGETLSIIELSKEWDIPTKTLQRDFKKLMEGSYGLVRAGDGKRFVLKQTSSSFQNSDTAIKMLDSLSADIGGEFYTKAQSALRRLQRHIDSPFYTRIDVESISDKLDLIEEIELAIAQSKLITFRYKRWYKPNEIKNYEHVKPYKIIIFDGFWYLLSEYKGNTIKFYLKELYNLKREEMTFDPDPQLVEKMNRAINIWFDPKKEPFEVVLELESNAIVYFERKPIHGQYLKKYPNGKAELTIEATHKKEVFSIVKRWFPQIKIIEPIELREEFMGMLGDYLRS